MLWCAVINYGVQEEKASQIEEETHTLLRRSLFLISKSFSQI